MAEPAPTRVLGTAGHIDHGKTSLVRALTGVDTDRLPEEKARGITIELGFAALDLAPDLRLGVIDVPGHEALVRTMVSGATGIDLVLLVVAADEGVMPQTREHVAICDLLGLERGAVALSRIDRVPPDVVELARQEVEGLLVGTSLAGAPIRPVCAPTGEGVPELRETLLRLALESLPRTPRSGPPRLAVDRAFAVRGFGAVATGTLIGGSLSVGDTLEIHPGGRRSRLRGIQRHGVALERVTPGGRCALNLQGVDLAELARGQVVTLPGALEPTLQLDASLRWLAVAPPLEDEVSASFLAGTLERRARVAPIGAARLAPGAEGFVRIRLEGEPAPLLPGDRFVLRGFARTEDGGATLGGGTILDVAPPRRRRSDPSLARDLARLARRDPAEDVRVRVERAGLAGLPEERLRRESGLDADALSRALDRLTREEVVCRAGTETLLAADALADLEARLRSALTEFHAREPLRPGMPLGALRGRLPENVPPAATELALARLVASGQVSLDGDRVRASSHRPSLGPVELEAVERLRAEARRAGLDPPSLRDWGARLALSAERVRELVAHLEREGALVRAPGDLFFDRAAVDRLRERVVAHLRAHGSLDTAAYKALIGTSRRAAVPLMELFDEEKVTLRSGERRVLRSGQGPQ